MFHLKHTFYMTVYLNCMTLLFMSGHFVVCTTRTLAVIMIIINIINFVIVFIALGITDHQG